MRAIERAAAFQPARLDNIDDPYARMHIRLNHIEDGFRLWLDLIREELDRCKEVIEKLDDDDQRRTA